MRTNLFLSLAVTAFLAKPGLADDVLLMTKEQVRQKHSGTELREPLFEPPGTKSALFLSENNRTRTYGFDSQDKVILVVEESNRVIPRGALLSECRGTKPWFWHVKMEDGSKKWVPVETIPSNAITKSPSDHQNSDGSEVAPDAFAKSKRTGNLLIVWDKTWAGNPDDAGFLKLDEELDAWITKIETLIKSGKPVVK